MLGFAKELGSSMRSLIQGACPIQQRSYWRSTPGKKNAITSKKFPPKEQVPHSILAVIADKLYKPLLL